MAKTYLQKANEYAKSKVSTKHKNEKPKHQNPKQNTQTHEISKPGNSGPTYMARTRLQNTMSKQNNYEFYFSGNGANQKYDVRCFAFARTGRVHLLAGVFEKRSQLAEFRGGVGGVFQRGEVSRDGRKEVKDVVKDVKEKKT
jgi:hypothetical protein